MKESFHRASTHGYRQPQVSEWLYRAVRLPTSSVETSCVDNDSNHRVIATREARPGKIRMYAEPANIGRQKVIFGLTLLSAF